MKESSLSKNPNFVWCTNIECRSGFIHEGKADDVACPHCHQSMCRKCKKKWDPAHEGISCKAFFKCMIDDPDGLKVAAYVAANCIECVQCHWKYVVVLGSLCVSCVRCPNKFCSGCGRLFKQAQECGKLESCQKRGLHAHHPRNCLFYMRDFDVAELQAFLTQHNIAYATTVEGRGWCQIGCGSRLEDGHAGLCSTHYKKYLVALINRNKLDPITMYTTIKIELMLTREEMAVPVQRDKLIRHVQQHLPLPNCWTVHHLELS